MRIRLSLRGLVIFGCVVLTLNLALNAAYWLEKPGHWPCPAQPAQKVQYGPPH